MNKFVTGLLSIFFFYGLSAAADGSALGNVPPAYYKYVECTGEQGAKIELYAETAGNTYRSALVTLYGFAYLGRANLELTQFSGVSGALQLSLTLQKDALGSFVNGLITSPSFIVNLTSCTDNAAGGGGSVSVHN